MRLRRSAIAENEAERQVSGGETSPDGVQWRATVPPEEGVQREPLPDGTPAPRARQRVGAERGPDKDMVPEQTGQDQEVEWLQEPAGAAAHGAGAVQPHHRRHVGRRDGRTHDRRVVVMFSPLNIRSRRSFVQGAQTQNTRKSNIFRKKKINVFPPPLC